MELTKEVVKREYDASIAALKAHKEGQKVHEIVSAAFKEILDKFPKEKK